MATEAVTELNVLARGNPLFLRENNDLMANFFSKVQNSTKASALFASS